MNLIYHPNEFLNTQVAELDLENPQIDLPEIKKNMVDLMLSHGGVGLAANQVGLNAQVFVMGDRESNCKICVNPMVLQHTEEQVVDKEGCLSFPGVFLNIRRPRELLVKFWDENLKEVVTKVSDYSAKCYLHEWDHLHGITFRDRVSKLKWERAEKKADKHFGKLRH